MAMDRREFPDSPAQRVRRDSGCTVNAPATIEYSVELRRRLADHLAGHDRREAPLDGRKHAAVAIVVTDSEHGEDRHDPLLPDDWRMDRVPGETDGLDGRMVGVSGGAAFLLCRRTSRLNKHAGQWALPGGRLDPGETAAEAALRELDEELGLRLGVDSVIGWLDDYPTRSGYVITPIIVWAGDHAELRPSPDEVLAVYRVGLHALRDGEARFVTIPESDRPVVQVPLGNDLIHAPTGAVLYQFRQVALLGRVNERVDHLEQPVFAWS
jgi:ADP-ribose pyrophosphatase YjhB (NUDIX family)